MDEAPHWTADELRRNGRAALDWVASYLDDVGRHPVLSTAAPGAVRARLPEHPPEHPEAFDAILGDLDDVVLPGVTHWQSPSFFAYFPANTSGPSILADLVSAGLGVQGMLWATSPACTELETHVLDWLVELLDLPEQFRGGGVIQDTASASTLCALLAARERVTGGAANNRGVDRPLTVYASVHAHSSVEKAVRIAGLGDERLRLIDADEAHALRPDRLAAAIGADREAGATPCLVVATIGTTSSTAIDPVAAIAEVCRAEQVWLHVDAAYAGSAAVCPELRWTHDGVGLADSYVFDPHKWLLTGFDCSCLYVADPDALVGALSILPEYLRNPASASGAVIDYRDWQIELGRRFRALKLWFVIRSYGAQGLRAHIRSGVGLAQTFAGWVQGDPDFEVVAPHPFSLVCFRHRGGDDVTQAILERVNASGEAFLTHTRLDGQLALRFAVGSPSTRLEHVERAWVAIQAAAT